MSRYLKEKGAVLVYVMVLMVCGSIITMTVFMRNLHQYKFSLIDRKVKTASYYANNAITDMMRQFSQEQYSDHYSAAAVDRSAASFNNGFAEVEIAPDDSDHTLYIEATGMYGSDVNDPDFTKRLTVMIKFISDFTAFGSYIDGDFETS
ncbi:MAG: hypothetical protein JXJ19_01815, partial [Elusimicrobia bacterium]|nr:hypothetical protein [Elusimicrobiota bacterium]